MNPRKIALAVLAVALFSIAATLSYWAFENYQSWYFYTYVEEDYSLAEADEVLMWVQIPSAVIFWIVGALVFRAAQRKRPPE